MVKLTILLQRTKVRAIVVAVILAMCMACSAGTADQQPRTLSELVASLGPDTRPDDLNSFEEMDGTQSDF